MTEEPRIPVELSLMGQLRSLAARGDFYTIIQRGDMHSGMLILLWRKRASATIYAQERNFDGVLGWRQVKFSAKTQESETDIAERMIADYIARATARDPDIWVVEVETQNSDFPLEGPVFDDLG